MQATPGSIALALTLALTPNPNPNPNQLSEELDDVNPNPNPNPNPNQLSEELDDVKKMNQMMLYAKVVTIRDAQVP